MDSPSSSPGPIQDSTVHSPGLDPLKDDLSDIPVSKYSEYSDNILFSASEPTSILPHYGYPYPYPYPYPSLNQLLGESSETELPQRKKNKLTEYRMTNAQLQSETRAIKQISRTLMSNLSSDDSITKSLTEVINNSFGAKLLSKEELEQYLTTIPFFDVNFLETVKGIDPQVGYYQSELYSYIRKRVSTAKSLVPTFPLDSEMGIVPSNKEGMDKIKSAIEKVWGENAPIIIDTQYIDEQNQEGE